MFLLPSGWSLTKSQPGACVASSKSASVALPCTSSCLDCSPCNLLGAALEDCWGKCHLVQNTMTRPLSSRKGSPSLVGLEGLLKGSGPEFQSHLWLENITERSTLSMLKDVHIHTQHLHGGEVGSSLTQTQQRASCSCASPGQTGIKPGNT